MSKEKIHEILLRVSELKTSKANEASTRFKLIDSVLIDVLGWTKDDINVEDRISEDDGTEFSDYTLSTGRHSIILEAKKIGENFSGAPKSRKAFLRGSWMKTPVGKPIRQARDYARRVGVGFCIATNGICWIAFSINRRDQVSFEESACIIFSDIEVALRNDLEEFQAIFSRSAVIGGSLDTSLLGYDRDQNEPRRLNNIYDRSFSRVNRSSIFQHIEREIITAFNEELLTDNLGLLEKCYVDTPERVRFDNRIQMYVASREQVIKGRPIKPLSKGIAPIQRLLRETQLSTRPIALLTLGLVGSGKTTFLNHVANVTQKDMFALSRSKDSPHWIYVDFRDFSKSQDPRRHAINSIFDYIKKHPLLKDYNNFVVHAYEDEIQALKSGPLAAVSGDERYIAQKISELLMSDYKEVEPYALTIMRYAAKFASVFVVIDNVDQIEDPETQSSIFLEATALARSVRGNLILAMRDSTYVKNRSSAVFDAFDFDAVYIEPPAILSVLSKRFVVAEQLMKGKSIEFDSEGGARIIVKDGKTIIDLLGQSVLGTEVGRIIEIAATGDTRLALQMTRQFLQYGYSSTARAVELYQRTGHYRLPPHEALRAIMLGNQGVYREQFSVFGNPFDSQLGRSDLQFLRIYIMHSLVLFSSEREFEGLPAREVIEALERLGIAEIYSEKVIKDLIKYRYIFSRSHQDYSRESIIIPSRLCGYVVRELISRLVFLETLLYDTFIGDDETWDQIKRNTAVVYRERNLINKLGVRREVVSLFFDFVEGRLEILVAEARARGMATQWCINPMTRVRDSFQDELRKALSSAQRIYGAENSAKISDLPLFPDVEG